MNLDAFQTRDDGFPICGFRAQFRWKSASSIAFQLGRQTEPRVFHVFGWLDVHATDDPSREIKMRICLPHVYLRYGDCETFINEVCTRLSVANDSYEASFISPVKELLFDTGLQRQFVSYGAAYEAGDNPWDDRDGVSPLEIISRETALSMLMAVCPEFHRRVDHIKPLFGELFLNYSATIDLADTIENAVQNNEQAQLHKLFEVLEKLVVYGDDYTRNASLARLFELLHQRGLTESSLVPYMLSKTREKSCRP